MTVFDWCKPTVNDHENCRRSFQRFAIDPKSNRVVWLDEHNICDCKVKSCPCSTKGVNMHNKPGSENRKKR